MVPRFVLSLFLIAAAAGSLQAAAPKNNPFTKPQLLSGYSGAVTGTLVEATSEFGEPSLMAGTTVWYAYTAPEDGCLVLNWDFLNDGGGFMDLAIVAGTSLKNLQPVENDWSFDAASDRWKTLLTVQKGKTYRFVFDADVEGGFTFDYLLATGGIFGVINPPRFRTIVEAGVGSASATREPEWRVREDAGTITLTVGRFGSTEGAASVGYSVVAGTASALSDYSGTVNGTLNFAAGQSQQTVTLNILNDFSTEPEESFSFKLHSPSANCGLLTDGVTVEIQDNDQQEANDSFENAALLTGEYGSVNIPQTIATVQTGEPALNSRSLWYLWVAPADGVLDLNFSQPGWSGPLAVYHGTLLSNLQPVVPLGFAAPSPLEAQSVPVASGTSYYIALNDCQGGGGLLSYQFASRSVFRLVRAEYEVAETAGNLTVTVERSGSLSGPVSVGYAALSGDPSSEDIYGAVVATPDVDFTPVSANLLFGNGEVSKTFQVPILPEVKTEALEYFDVRLSVVPGDDPDSPIVIEPSLTRVYIVDSKKPVALPEGRFSGSWVGLLETTSGLELDGLAQLTFTTKRGFTGYVMIDGKKSTIKGTFPPFEEVDGETISTVTVNASVPANANAIGVTLRLQSHLDGSLTLRGTVATVSGTANFVGLNPVKYPTTGRAPNAGSYTIALQPGNGFPAEMDGVGYASVMVKPTGAFTLAGALPDGTKFSGGGQVALGPLPLENGVVVDTGRPLVLPFCMAMYSGQGSLSGRLQLRYPGDRSQPASWGDGDGAVRWVHPPLKTGAFRNPFRGAVEVEASRYVVPKGSLVLPGIAPMALELEFSGADLANEVTAPLVLKTGATAKLEPPTHPSKATLSFVSGTGLFSGKFTAPDNQKCSFIGAVLRNSGAGAGFFLKGSASGKVELEPTPP